MLPCSAFKLVHSLFVQLHRKVTRLGYLNMLVHQGKLGTHHVSIPLFVICIQPTQENINYAEII